VKKAEEPTRRSARNLGMEPINYNIDAWLDAADGIELGGKGGKCIDVMLA
jgi:hypothetical protein